MGLEVCELPLPPSWIEKLCACGYSAVADLNGISSSELAHDLTIPPDEAARLLAQVRARGLGKQRARPPVSALELLDEERRSSKLFTFVRELDELLSGGIPMRQLTEIVGVPGIGKTQFSMQLALNVQIPRVFHGMEGEAVYIDTEGSFMAERASDMATCLIKHLRFTAERDQNSAQAMAAQNLTASDFLNRIHYYRVYDAAELLASVRALRSFLAGHTEVKLIVVDSVAFHFRHGVTEYTKRHQMLGQITQSLTEYAMQQPLAVLMVNQVTTKVNEAANTSSVQPALGESWAHLCNIQVMLQWANGVRVARLYKGGEPGTAQFTVSEEGVRSAHPATKRPADGPLIHESSRMRSN